MISKNRFLNITTTLILLASMIFANIPARASYNTDAENYYNKA